MPPEVARPDLDALLTPGEVASLFRVTAKTVTRWADGGKLPFVRTLGGHRRFRLSAVLDLIDASAEVVDAVVPVRILTAAERAVAEAQARADTEADADDTEADGDLPADPDAESGRPAEVVTPEPGPTGIDAVIDLDAEALADDADAVVVLEDDVPAPPAVAGMPTNGGWGTSERPD